MSPGLKWACHRMGRWLEGWMLAGGLSPVPTSPPHAVNAPNIWEAGEGSCLPAPDVCLSKK